MALLAPGLCLPFVSNFYSTQTNESVFVPRKNTYCRKEEAETMSPMRAIIYQRQKGEELLQNNTTSINQKMPSTSGSKSKLEKMKHSWHK